MSSFMIMSPEFNANEALNPAHEFNGFDGTGQNLSPALRWEGAPRGTQGYALTLYDPDAPTGSGFWHWVMYDIPATVTRLDRCAGSDAQFVLAGIGLQALNDFGVVGYGGPCPPKGDKPHRYLFTVHALRVPTLGLPTGGVTNAVVRFMIHQNTLVTASLAGLYQRS